MIYGETRIAALPATPFDLTSEREVPDTELRRLRNIARTLNDRAQQYFAAGRQAPKHVLNDLLETLYRIEYQERLEHASV